MKKSIWLAVIGAAALTGCNTEVMQQRAYVPAPHEDVEAAKPANNDPFATDNTGAEQVKNAPETAPSVQELPAMTGNFKNEGVSEDAPLADTGKKGSRKGGKQGKTVAAAAGEYVVRSGDTPEKIARKHHVRLSALMEANNLTEESAKRLKIGQKLVIPAREATAKGGKAVKGGKKGFSGGAPAAGPGEYVVRSGDTPEKIARRHHVRLSALMEANNLSDEDAKRLKIGQKLVIPAPGAKSTGKTAQPNKGNAVKETPAAPAGDNGGRTGGRDLEEGADTPATPPPSRIEVENGYLVDVPRDMTVTEFARLNNVPEAELRKLNPNMPADMLRKESSYVIPKN